MNEKILRALMQLIALVAQFNKSTFHSQAELIRDLCKQLTIELNQEDRMVLFLSFLELINFDRQVTAQESDFAAAIAKEFKIDQIDYLNALDFIFGNPPVDILTSDCLIIGKIEPDQTDQLEGSWIEKNKPAAEQINLYLNKPLMEGKIYVLQIKDVGFYALKYFGKQEVFLNKKKIVPGKFYTLRLYDTLYFKDNDSISYNTVNGLFRDEKQGLKLQIHGQSVSCSSTTGKQTEYFHPFTFTEESGNLIGIIGPPKTTELVLKSASGITKNFKGDILLNNYSVKTEYYKIFKYIGYIPDESIFDPEITVFQNLFLNVRLYYPHFSRQRLEQMATTILLKYQMHDVRNVVPSMANEDEFTKVHMHLLNFAITMVSEPLVIYMLSPLDGLSSSDGMFLLQIIAKEAINGRIVFLSSHNPNPAIFKLADKLWIFDEQGYIIYNGQPALAFDYFNNFQHNIVSAEKQCAQCGALNPDQLFQIIQQKEVNDRGCYNSKRKVTPLEWHQYYQEHNEKDTIPPNPRKVLPFLNTAIPGIQKQYHVFLHKIFSTRLRNFRKTGIKLLIAPLVSVLIALLLRHDWSANYTFGQNPNIHLYSICSMVFLFMFGFVYGVREAKHENVFIGHYHSKTLSSYSYLNATFTWLAICSVIISLLYTLLGNSILQIEGFFFHYWLIFQVILLMAGALGILFSTFFKNEFNVYVLSGIFLLFNIIFGGVAIEFKNLPHIIGSDNTVPALAELSFLRWSFEALTVDQVKNNKYEKYFYSLDKNMEISNYYASVMIPALLNQVNRIDLQLYKTQTNLIRAIRDEINYIPTLSADIYPFEFVNDLKPESITQELLAETSDYLTYAQMQFSDGYQSFNNQHVEMENFLRKSMGNNTYQRFVTHNYNSFLYHFCNPYLQPRPVSFNGDKFVRTIDPLFILPVSNLGKAQLFAPLKRYNGFYYETFWFNLLVLWTFVFLIFVINLVVFQRIYL